MTTIRHRLTSVVWLTLTFGALLGTPASAQCPDNIPQSVVNSLQHQEVRAQAAASPRLTSAFIAQNGGIASMLQKVRAQLAADREWLAQEEANQRTLAQQGMANDARARTGRDLIQRMRDNQRLTQAYLQLLECHAGQGGATRAGASDANQAAVAAHLSRAQRDAQDNVIGDRTEMVNKVTGSWQPPRSFADGSSAAAISLEDPFAAPADDECRPSISFRNVRLSADGAAIGFETSAITASGRACTVSFGLEMRMGSQVVRLPSRTLLIPATGVTLPESLTLPVPVETTTSACTSVEPMRRAFLDQRDQLAAKYQKIQQLGRDTLANRRELERAVTMRDVGTALLRVSLAVDALKLGLSVVHPAAGDALDFGQCVGVELATYVGKTMVACAGDDTSGCTSTVLKDGGVWVEKNLACAFKQTFNTVDRLVDAAELYNRTGEIQDSMNARSKTLEVMGQLDDSLNNFVNRLARIREDRSFIDEAVRQLDGLCRSPLIQLTAVDVKPLTTSGK